MPEFDALEFAEIEAPAVQALQIERECGSDPTVIGEAVNAAFDQLGTSLRQMQLNPTGPPRIIYTSYSPDKVCFTLAIPINALPSGVVESGAASAVLMTGGKYMRFTHRGSYSDLAGTYSQIAEYLKKEGLMESEADWMRYMPMWEEYMNDPDETPEQDLLTYIYLPKV